MNVSCIIPVYNAENTLRRCVESILYGKEKDIEVILVDDCSKDGSWALCQALSQEYSNIIAVQNEKNSGVSHTRNRGLQEAHGTYVLFVDSDDWVSRNYASSLLMAAKTYSDRLIVSGFSYCDLISGRETIYALNPNENKSDVAPENFFTLVSSNLIQSSCNKIFRKDIVDQFQLHFDEEQSMGEDFQFVLDYMRTAQVTGCVVLNTPLYYYVHANTPSLMSQFGIGGFKKSVYRLEQLAKLGHIKEAELNQQIERLKQNYIYHIVRYPKYSRQEKLDSIASITQDNTSGHHYYQQKKIMTAESLYAAKNSVKHFKDRCIGKIQRMKRAKVIQKVCQQVHAQNFTIISQNCIGGVFYHDIGMQFLSPTINLYMKACDFSRFVLNLKTYIDMELEMHWLEKYPVGVLGDITIYFQHYTSCSEAKAIWEKRKARINWDKILVLSTDHEGFNKETYQLWKQISYPKVLFTAQEQFSKDENVVYFPEYNANGCVPDLIPNREFYRGGTLVQTTNRL